MRLPHHLPAPHQTDGFTLVETLMAMGAAGLLIGVIATLSVFTSQSFSMMSNYVDLDAQSRNAVDVLSREIRDASALVSFSTSSPKYLQLTNATAGQTIQIMYNSSTRTLWLDKTGEPWQPLLTQCDRWDFSLYDRHPDITSTNIAFYPATNSTGQLDPKFCKLINLSWKCSRTVLGSKLNTESVQTAQIVLRNKVR